MKARLHTSDFANVQPDTGDLKKELLDDHTHRSISSLTWMFSCQRRSTRHQTRVAFHSYFSLSIRFIS